MKNWQKSLDDELDGLRDYLIGFRRELHQHPELSMQEFETTKRIAAEVSREGLSHRVLPQKTGVVIDSLGGDGAGPTIALRADIDALPMQDKKQVAHASKVPGVMHACGHDVHSTVVLGATIALNRIKEKLPESFNLRTIFQPSEELASGAFLMIEEGALESVDKIIGLHCDPHLELGTVAIREGVINSACLDFEVEWLGKSSHAARPFEGRDALYAATQFVTTSYGQIGRSVDGRESYVLSFCEIHGGTSSNLVADSVRISGTIRAYCFDVAKSVKAALLQISDGIAKATDTNCQWQFPFEVGAVVNHRSVSDAIETAAVEVVGDASVKKEFVASLGAEDFAAYLEKVPGAMFRLGVFSKRCPQQMLHTPLFDVDEDSLIVGARTIARAAVYAALANADK